MAAFDIWSVSTSSFLLSTKDKRGESELFKYCMKCYDTAQSMARQEIKLHVCSTRGRAQRGWINGRLALVSFALERVKFVKPQKLCYDKKK